VSTVNDTVQPARRLQLALDPTTPAEEHVFQALLYHLTEPELAVLANMAERRGRRDRWPS
jgi:hypothetical protein